MKLYFHIGPGKTGSSSIQNAAITHSSELNKSGILVPTSDRSASGDFHGFAERVAAAQNAKDILPTLQQIVAEAKTANCDKLVMSSDFFANLSYMKLKLLKEACDESGIDVHVIVYLRNLFKIALSTLQQQIQNGKHLSSVYVYKPFTYYSMLLSYANAFGEAAIDLRPYAADTDKSWSAVVDFFGAIQCEIEHKEHAWVNRSITQEKLKLINFFNFYFNYPARQKDLRINEMFRWVIHNIPDVPERKLSLSKKEILFFSEYFQHDRELFQSFAPNLNPYDRASYLQEAPDGMIGDSFDELVCAKPSFEELELVFATIGSNASETDLKSEIGVNV